MVWGFVLIMITHLLQRLWAFAHIRAGSYCFPPFLFLGDQTVKVCVFVDGENFRYSICELFKNKFNKEDYLPKNADWNSFFNWIAKEKANSDAERLRAYWYVTEHIDFFPYILPSWEKDSNRLLKSLRLDEDTKKKLTSLQDEELREEAIRIRKALKSLTDSMSSRFNGWNTVHKGIAQKHNAVEIPSSWVNQI